MYLRIKINIYALPLNKNATSACNQALNSSGSFCMVNLPFWPDEQCYQARHGHGRGESNAFPY